MKKMLITIQHLWDCLLINLDHRRSSSRRNIAVLPAVCLLYLIIPFLIFCFGWFNPIISILSSIIIIWVIIRFISSNASQNFKFQNQVSKWIVAGLILGIWVFLSGIGGYTFQNTDFQIRNAIFRDLIQYHWPVIYPNSGNPTELVYYIGYWLPAALLGKVIGWDAANFMLFIWTLLGVIFVVNLVSSHLRISPIPISIFVILFSGMDIVGTIIIQSIAKGAYPSVWPPYQHLDGWTSGIQYSSITTQLFWVFNQALPAWVCIALLIYGISDRYKIFTWSLCFFFAPLPAIGLLPFIAVQALIPLSGSHYSRHVNGLRKKMISLFETTKRQLRDFMSLENILGGGSVFFLSYLYFRTNQNTTRFSIAPITLVSVLIAYLFCILEWSLIWIILYNNHRKSPLWYLVGFILITFPFIRLGNGGDFTMRASIPALFYLMVWFADAIFNRKAGDNINSAGNPRMSFFILLACLILGAFTPIYEMNRSIYRTASYYLCPSIPIAWLCSAEEWKRTDIKVPQTSFIPSEASHPGSLIADDVLTLAGDENLSLVNFIAKPDLSGIGLLFFRYPSQIILESPIQ
ncbi:MAG: hypothetical protein PHQ40_02935 [Anaerolineaceae bacterium]|nr:hypothetical protein [Anaerolineaceae bacterium]